jgi:hypothetical protein
VTNSDQFERTRLEVVDLSEGTTMKIKNEEIFALVQAQPLLPDYSADPFVQRRVGLVLAKSGGARTNEKDGLDWPVLLSSDRI